MRNLSQVQEHRSKASSRMSVSTEEFPDNSRENENPSRRAEIKVWKNEMKLRKKEIKVPKNSFVSPWIIKKLHRRIARFPSI